MKLQVNGKTVAVEVQRFSYEGDVLAVKTAGNEQLVVKGSEPAPDPDPDPIPDPDPPVDPPDDVIVRYPIDSWPNERRRQLAVPKGRILASAFITTSETKAGGIYYQFEATAFYDAWISETPGGEPISQYANRKRQSGISTKINWRQGPSPFVWYAELKKGKRYYLNLRHTDPNQAATTILRMVQ